MIFAETTWPDVAMTFTTIILVPLVAAVAYLIKQLADAKKAALETKDLINGRMDEIKRNEYSKGFKDGVAQGMTIVGKAVVDSPNVSVEAKDVSKAMVEAANLKGTK